MNSGAAPLPSCILLNFENRFDSPLPFSSFPRDKNCFSNILLKPTRHSACFDDLLTGLLTWSVLGNAKPDLSRTAQACVKVRDSIVPVGVAESPEIQ